MISRDEAAKILVELPNLIKPQKRSQTQNSREEPPQLSPSFSDSENKQEEKEKSTSKRKKNRKKRKKRKSANQERSSENDSETTDEKHTTVNDQKETEDEEKEQQKINLGAEKQSVVEQSVEDKIPIVTEKVKNFINDFLNKKPKPGVSQRLNIYAEYFPQFINGWTPQTIENSTQDIPERIEISNKLFLILSNITGKRPKNIKRGISEFFKKRGLDNVSNYRRGISIFRKFD
ncbi:hypothetical protein M0811_00053 [Anaeramoeba ignava]|uniref:Uncharacterized protein n=1 Tax=Anaeramoeba ignava TaxID=1746090 RepID=A0A9Q0RDL5_ANAIG|nr:hypothetical protein M0811_00053 [Anaeramoeba ignava]